MYLAIFITDSKEYTVEFESIEDLADFIEDEDIPVFHWVNSYYEYTEKPGSGLIVPKIPTPIAPIG